MAYRAFFLFLLVSATSARASGLEPEMIENCDLSTLEAAPDGDGYTCRAKNGQICDQHCGEWRTDDGWRCAYQTVDCADPVPVHPHPTH